MESYVNASIVTVNYTADTAHMKVVYTPIPEDGNDQNPAMSVIEIKYCPNCGDLIVPYSESVPAPTYVRATLLGASCNDNTCRFNDSINHICCWQFMNSTGCFATSDAAKQAYSDLRDSVQLGWSEMTSE